MAKSFFKSYVRVKEKLADYKDEYSYEEQTVCRVYTDKCYTCLQAVEKYLYSYRWCKSEKEKILLQTANSCKTAEVIAQEMGIPYSTFRAMSSKVSRRLYDQLGMDFDKVILGNDEKEQVQLTRKCISRCEDFDLSSLYPDFLFSKMKEIADSQDMEVSENLKIGRENMVLIKFLADYSREGIFKSLELIDGGRLALYFTILTDNKYFNERVELLERINEFKQKTTKEQKYREAVLTLNRGVLIPKREYEEFKKYKEGKKCNKINMDNNVVT